MKGCSPVGRVSVQGVADPRGERPSPSCTRRDRFERLGGSAAARLWRMILVDTAVWTDHLHSTESRLVDLLAIDEVGCHPLVVEELALGSINERDVVLDLLANLRQFSNVDHREVLHLVDRRRLWGRGLSVVDARLMAAVALADGGQMWTRDQRLKAACIDVGLPVVDE